MNKVIINYLKVGAETVRSNSFLKLMLDDSDIIIRVCKHNINFRDDSIVIATEPNAIGIYDFLDISPFLKPFNERKFMHRLLEINNIKTPKTTAYDNTINGSYHSLVKSMVECGFDLNPSTPIAIRPIKTARSLGNLVISLKQLEDFMFITNTIDKRTEVSDVRAVYNKHGIELPPDDLRGFYVTDKEKFRIEHNLLSSTGFTIQEVVPDITKEIRLYYHPGINVFEDFEFIVERTGFSLNAKKDDMKESISYSHHKYMEFSKVAYQIIQLFKELKILTASIDLYMDSKGDIGCLEFSTEYTFDGVPAEDIARYIFSFKHSLLDYVNEKIKKKDITDTKENK